MTDGLRVPRRLAVGSTRPGESNFRLIRSTLNPASPPAPGARATSFSPSAGVLYSAGVTRDAVPAASPERATVKDPELLHQGSGPAPHWPPGPRSPGSGSW